MILKLGFPLVMESNDLVLPLRETGNFYPPNRNFQDVQPTTMQKVNRQDSSHLLTSLLKG
jgi:hypothetical protein